MILAPSGIAIGGRIFWKLVRRGKVIRRGLARNGVTTAGRNDMLNDHFRGTVQISSWYAGLVDSSGFTAFAAADSMSSHSGWTESVVYSNANRPAVTFNAASGALISNAGTPAAFNINGTATLKGIFITSSNTKSGTTGALWATATLDADLSVVNLDTLNLTYEVELQALA